MADKKTKTLRKIIERRKKIQKNKSQFEKIINYQN